MRYGRRAETNRIQGEHTRRLIELSVTLPAAQFVAAVVLLKLPYQMPRVDTLYMPTSQLIVYGINGPALLMHAFRPFYYRLNDAPWNVFGLDQEGIFFLAGVIVLWFLIGRALERYLSGQMALTKLTIRAAILYACLIFLGVVFLGGGIDGLLTFGMWNNPIGNYIENFLFLLWGLALILIPGGKFIGAIRRRFFKSNTQERPKQILSYK